jgi:hypothetical protein
MELYAAASFQKEIYIFTPILRRDGMYAWIKIPPYPPHVELAVFPPRDTRLLNEIDHMELCHSFGDVVQSTDGLCPPSEAHFKSEISKFVTIIVYPYSPSL